SAKGSLEEARSAARQIVQRVEERKRAEARLASLAHLRDREGALAVAMEWLEARARTNDALRARDAFAERSILEGLTEGDLRRWKEDSETLASREARVRGAEGEKSAAAETGREIGLGPEGVAGAVLDELTAHVRAADEAERRRQEIAIRLAGLGDEMEEGGTGGRAVPAEGGEPTDDAVDLASLEARLAEAQQLAERRARLEARIAEGAGADAGPEIDEFRERADLLRRWLRVPEAMEDEIGRARRRLGYVGAATALLGALAILVGIGASPVAFPLLLFGIVGVLLGVGSVAMRPRATTDARSRRSGIESEARRRGWVPSAWGDRWTRAAVEDELLEVERGVVEAERRALRREERRAAAGEVRVLEREEDAHRAELYRIADVLGISRDAGVLSIHAVGTARAARAARARERRALALQIEEAEGEIARILDKARTHLQPLGHAPTDLASLQAAVRDLERRVKVFEEARRSRTDAERRIAEGEAEIEAIRSRRARFLERIGLDATEIPPESIDARLHRLSADLAPFDEARREVEARRRDTARTEGVLAELARGGNDTAETLLATAEPGDLSALRDDHRGVEREIGDLEDLQREVDRIEGELRTARHAHDVERARVAKAEAETELRRDRDDSIEAEVGDALAGWVHARVSERTRPAVFKRAERLFSEVTRGRWELRMREGERSTFAAFDTTAGALRDLSELSGGTRLQLLLCVRVAFVEVLEGDGPSDLRLPLLMDEVLANCDDERASAIIDTALFLAREGRQIFYLTAQGDEVAKWRSALDAAGMAYREERLAPLPDDDALPFEWDVDDRVIAPPPDPGDLDHAAYGREIDVPRWDPRTGLGSLHLWHLVDDPRELHTLLTLGVQRWGALDSLCARSHSLPDEVRAIHGRARRRAWLAERFRRLWTRGRGRPLDRAVLEAAAAVSEVMVDRVADFAETIEWDPRALLRGLREGEVSRFHQAKVEELEAFLIEDGYIEHDSPLAHTEIVRILLAEASAEGIEISAEELVAMIECFRTGAA
ncbi:MAG: hypothetical protein RQ745_05400, partial [Longimicrobiales bacterium]|nr:hypothetical protein [Longimicrobiales bacterium]